MTKPNNYPLGEIISKAMELAADGADLYQKFTCIACSQRLTMDVPNHFYTHGHCDKCGAITDIRTTGCNYLLHLGADRTPKQVTLVDCTNTLEQMMNAKKDS